MNVQAALDQLEETIFDSPRLLWFRTLVNEEILYEQLDQIRLNLPTAFQEAEELLRQREDILEEANAYARDLLTQAEQRARKLVEESVIVRQAQSQAEQILRQSRQEHEDYRRQTLQEIEQLQREANHYVDQVLQNLEMHLLESLRVIRNGRQNLR
jgi:F0F1-type ATP synthase membrane subunit b/b'